MNRYRRTLLPIAAAGLPIAAAGLLAACSSATPTPSADPADTRPTPTSSASSGTAASTDPASASPRPTQTDGDAHEHEAVTVDITNFAFSPTSISVAPGTEITFTNLDTAPHTVTAGSDGDPMPEIFDSGLLEQGESFTFVFEEAGTYAYFCDRHPPMEGTVTVED